MEREPIKKILDYELLSLIGKGSFSEVYEAKKGNLTVAIKLMKPPASVDSNLILSSLRYEFWVLKDLVHPNIVRLFDFGQLPEGRLYLILELIKGVPLDVFCRHRLFKECESVFVDVLVGLSELARWGIVHGDIKPANIFVTDLSSKPRAKILDFGMAHPHASQSVSGGTPSTMPPEVILHRLTDHRSDLYSLGVSLYASLTGQNPFIAETIEKTLKTHLDKTVEPIGLFCRDISPPWAALITQLMEKNPEDRPISAQKALSLVSRETFVLSPTSFVGRKASLARAIEIEPCLASGKKAALVVRGKPGVGVSRFLREVFYRLISHHPALREEMAIVEGEPYPEKQILFIDRMPPPKGYEGIQITLNPFLKDEVNEWLSLIFNVQDIPKKFLDSVYSLTKGHPQSIWDLLLLLTEKKAWVDARGLVTRSTLTLIDWQTLLPEKEENGELAENMNWLFEEAKRKIRARNFFENDPLWQKIEALVSKEKDPQTKLIQRAHFLSLKGEALIDEGKWDRAREVLNAALEIDRVTPGYKVSEIRVRNFLSYILLREGNVSQAVLEFEAALNEVKQGLSQSEAREITNLSLGLAYLQAGQYQKAINRLEEEIQIHDGQPLRQMGTSYNLAQAHSGLENFAQAEKYYHEVIRTARAHHDAAFILRGLNGLSIVLQNTSRWEESLEGYLEALELALALKDFSSAAAIAQNRGGLASKHGLTEEAIHNLADSLKYAEQIKASHPFEKKLVCRSHVELGEIFLGLHRFLDAKEHIDRAWHLAENDPMLADFRFWILVARCRFWKAKEDRGHFQDDLAKLNFYTDTPEKQKKWEELKTSFETQSSNQQKTETQINQISLQTAELESILEITADLLSDFELPELLKHILIHAIKLSGAELGVILLADDKGNLKPVSSLNASLDEDLCDISLSVAKEALHSGRVVCANDALREEHFSHSQSVMALNLRSLVGLPILFRGKNLGVLYLSHRYQPALFDERIVKILSLFANQVGLALTHHQLLESQKLLCNSTLTELEETRFELTLTQEKIRNLPQTDGPIETKSRAVLEILDQLDRVANTPLSLLFYGETGTGKELLARYAHDGSHRRQKPFIAINCGALPANLIESELFGHAKGAFTGADRDKIGLIEAAHSGTLFLDEITDLPIDAQVKLLRVLEEREVVRLGETKPKPVDLRLMAACQKSIKEAVFENKFREDLSYRLMGLEIFLPPLRERVEDIPLLAHYFFSESVKGFKKNQPVRMAASFLHVLTQYPWPGNVRELKNIITTAIALCDHKILSLEDLPKNLRDQLTQAKKPYLRPRQQQEGLSTGGWYQPGKTWREHEFLIYASSLMALHFHVPRVAASLGVGVATVYKWMRENKFRESANDWKNKILPYRYGVTLNHLRATIFSQAAKRFLGHPYHAARDLDVSPVTFYRWSSMG